MTTAEKATKDRAALAEKHPDSWIPVEAGDTIEGVVVDVDLAWSDQRDGGSNYPLVTIRTANGAEKKIHAFGAVLYREITAKRPKVGESIAITYHGQGKVPDGAPADYNPPELYRVRAGSGDSIYDQLPNARKTPAAESTQAL